MKRKKLFKSVFIISLIIIFVSGCEYFMNTSVYPEKSGNVKVVEKKEVAEKKVVTIEAQANKGWEFDHWEGNLKGDKSKVQMVVDGNVFIRAVFRQSNINIPKPGKVVMNETAGHNWLVYIPRSLNKIEKSYIYMNLLYGQYDDYQKSIRDAKRTIKGLKGLAERNKFIIFIPIFAKNFKNNYYCQGLNRSTLNETTPDFYYRPDMKTNVMLDSLLYWLSKKNYKVNKKVIVDGMSAGGMWANKYTILHPERVAVAVMGQAGGWLTMPIKEYKNEKLEWPHGLYDYKNLIGKEYDHYAELKSIPMLVYIGSKDTEHTYYSSEKDIEFFEMWGKEDPEILKNQVNYLKRKGYNIKFKLFPGLKHEITDETTKYTINFIKDNI